MNWFPIDTAPKDGSIIDLWVNDEFPKRWTDCYWGKPGHECGEMGQHCDSDWHGSKPGWVDGTFGEFLGKYTVRKITHWQPLPDPPSPDSISIELKPQEKDLNPFD
jgi:hypothetical protein